MTAGHIDPSITASSQREAAMLQTIRRRGLSLHRVHASGPAMRLIGPGVFMLLTDLSVLHESDLAPALSRPLYFSK